MSQGRFDLTQLEPWVSCPGKGGTRVVTSLAHANFKCQDKRIKVGRQLLLRWPEEFKLCVRLKDYKLWNSSGRLRFEGGKG